MRYLLIVIIIMFVGWYYYKKRCIEGLNTFNGRLAIDDQYYYDKLFDNVVYIPNSPEIDGWTKCTTLKGPLDNCVEFGLTGDTYLFQNS